MALQSTVTTRCSPFDPVVWHRARARVLFGFDYQIECYTPAPKRRYGYFTLPILHRGALVGRLDPKAHRKDGVFEVKALHLEPGVSLSDELVAAVAGVLRACAAWHGTPEVIVRAADPPAAAERLTAALA
ncbi:MAG: crosslink repair DNA glycosylase YcaQ family protein [Dehalococcoidia bacterium]